MNDKHPDSLCLPFVIFCMAVAWILVAASGCANVPTTAQEICFSIGDDVARWECEDRYNREFGW